MKDLLFDIPESKSPRLLWMERYNVKTYDASRTALYMKGDDPPYWCWTGDATAEDLAETGAVASEYFTQAATKDEAIALHAKIRGIPLWNEI